MSESSPQKLDAESFKACEGQTFTIPTDQGPLELVLAQVSSLKGDTPREDQNPFSLLFRGPSEAHFEQQIVPMTNGTLGRLELFLVPLGPDPKDENGSTLFEAIFT